MSALVTVDDLATELTGDRPPVLLDVQWNLVGPPGREAYADAHLPGAHFLDLEAELAGPAAAPDGEGRRPGGRHPLPSPAVVEAALRRAGVEADSAVVVYDQGRGAFGAARAWWVLRWLGLTDVRVLDGGLAAWQEAGQPVTQLVPEAATGSVAVRPGGVPVLDADGAAALAHDGVLLDARAAERYSGDIEPMDPVAGHVPGAVSAPTAANLSSDGRLLPADALRDRFAGLGVNGSVPVGTYCGSGVSAAQQVLALHEAGIEAALYVGSWSDWVGIGRPAAVGPEPA